MPIEPFYRDLGRRVEQARRQKKLTQEQLALSLQPTLKRVTVSNIETGKQRVLVHMLVNLAAVLDVEVSSLLPRASKSPKGKRATNLQQQLAATLSNPQAKAIMRTIESKEAGAK